MNSNVTGSNYILLRMNGQREFLDNLVSGSCVYGVVDLTELLQRPELVAHKLYLDLEPAAYFCLYRAIRLRTLDKERQQKFQGILL